MTDAIDFLEQLGQEPRLRHAPTPELEGARREPGSIPSCSSALLTEMQRASDALLGAQPNICCLIEKPERRARGGRGRRQRRG